MDQEAFTNVQNTGKRGRLGAHNSLSQCAMPLLKPSVLVSSVLLYQHTIRARCVYYVTKMLTARTTCRTKEILDVANLVH